MKLTLHTHHAARIWHGRRATETKNGIIGLSAFAGIMTRMKRGAELDDPYSDWWMIRIEEKLIASKLAMTALQEELDQIITDVPNALSIGENLSVHPVTLPIFLNAQLGFLAVYLLTQYDEYARRLLLAHHTALIGRRDMERWLDAGAHVLRSLFGLAQQYKYLGTSREDLAANNARAQEAIKIQGELPQDILDGTRRSEFAPPILRAQKSTEPAEDHSVPEMTERSIPEEPCDDVQE
jgi:integrating conjugative element protein (TIGR03761 family)